MGKETLHPHQALHIVFKSRHLYVFSPIPALLCSWISAATMLTRFVTWSDKLDNEFINYLKPAFSELINIFEPMFLELINQSLTDCPPGKCDCDFKWVNLKHSLGIDVLSIPVNITLEWMPEDLIDGKSTLVQVMARCHQARSHYLSQCWPISVSPYDIIRPQWVKVKLPQCL